MCFFSRIPPALLGRVGAWLVLAEPSWAVRCVINSVVLSRGLAGCRAVLAAPGASVVQPGWFRQHPCWSWSTFYSWYIPAIGPAVFLKTPEGHGLDLVRLLLVITVGACCLLLWYAATIFISYELKRRPLVRSIGACSIAGIALFLAMSPLFYEMKMAFSGNAYSFSDSFPGALHGVFLWDHTLHRLECSGE